MAIAVVAADKVTGSPELIIHWIPFPGPNQEMWLVGLGVLGLLCVWLAATGKVRFLLFLFAIHTSYSLVKGLFANMSFSFTGPDQARDAAILVAASLLAVIGSWPVAPKRNL